MFVSKSDMVCVGIAMLKYETASTEVTFATTSSLASSCTELHFSHLFIQIFCGYKKKSLAMAEFAACYDV